MRNQRARVDQWNFTGNNPGLPLAALLMGFAAPPVFVGFLAARITPLRWPGKPLIAAVRRRSIGRSTWVLFGAGFCGLAGAWLVASRGVQFAWSWYADCTSAGVIFGAAAFYLGDCLFFALRKSPPTGASLDKGRKEVVQSAL